MTRYMNDESRLDMLLMYDGKYVYYEGDAFAWSLDRLDRAVNDSNVLLVSNLDDKPSNISKSDDNDFK